MIKEAIARLTARESLTEGEAQQVTQEIMDGIATPAQIAGFLISLRMKGETQEEVLGMARTMRAKAIVVNAGGDLLDTCGTGGDGSGTFNISTAAGLVAAAAGVRVAKHGNRSASSKCGSADVLEALGAKLTLTPEQAKESLDKTGFAFLFAQAYHPAMRFAGPVRGELGVRTVFNNLGPLSNPANAAYQLVGVSDPVMLPKMAFALQQLGTKHALLVRGRDGLDEISLNATTDVYEIRLGIIEKMTVTPELFEIPRVSAEELAGGDKAENALIIQDLFRGAVGPKRNALLVNAGAALYVAGKVPHIREGMGLAARTIDSGAARRTLDAYIKVTQGFAA